VASACIRLAIGEGRKSEIARADHYRRQRPFDPEDGIVEPKAACVLGRVEVRVSVRRVAWLTGAP
jgi:hypothetical protein